MLVIKIDFSPEVNDQFTTNGIRVLTDTSKVTSADLFSAMQVCVGMRRSSSILDKMVIEVEKNRVKITPTDGYFREIKEEDAQYVPLGRIPLIHDFFKELRQDITIGMQDHLNLEAEKPAIKRNQKAKRAYSGPRNTPPNTVINKRWKRKK